MATTKKKVEDCERGWRIILTNKEHQTLANLRYYGTEKDAKKEGRRLKKEQDAEKVEYVDLGE